MTIRSIRNCGRPPPPSWNCRVQFQQSVSPTRSEIGLNPADHVVVGRNDRDEPPPVEGAAWMADAEAQNLAGADLCIGGDPHKGMLVVHRKDLEARCGAPA